MRRRTIGDTLDPARNSLNFLRLVLAVMVMASHGGLGSLGVHGMLINGTTWGTMAVYGFFGISGYLIAGSALRNNFGRYLWQRSLRILPAFWVCLVVTAFGFGLLGWITSHHPPGSYLDVRPSPFGFVWRNWLLNMNQLVIGTQVWVASLWTLFYEFLCYLIVGALALAGILRRPAFVALAASGLWALTVLLTITPGSAVLFNPERNAMLMTLLKFAVVFMVGAALYVFRDRVPDSGWLALGCAAVYFAGLFLPTDGINPAFVFSKPDLVAPLVAYPLLWLGAHLPFERVGAKNDYSYGIYIYGFPVQMLLFLWGAWRWGFLPYLAVSIAGTIPFAVASWWLVERRALSLKRLKWRAVQAKVLGLKTGEVV